MSISYFCGNIFENLGIEPITMLFYFINIVILIIVIRIFFYKPIKNIIKYRKQKVEETFIKNKQLNESVEKTKQEYEETLKKTRIETEKLLEDTQKKAQEQAEKELNEAKEKAKKIIDEAYKDVEHIKENLYDEMREKITQYSILIAAKILEREVNVGDNKKFIDNLLSNMK